MAKTAPSWAATRRSWRITRARDENVLRSPPQVFRPNKLEFEILLPTCMTGETIGYSLQG